MKRFKNKSWVLYDFNDDDFEIKLSNGGDLHKGNFIKMVRLELA